MNRIHQLLHLRNCWWYPSKERAQRYSVGITRSIWQIWVLPSRQRDNIKHWKQNVQCV